MKKLTGISLFIFFCVTTSVLTAGLVFYQNKNNTNIPTGTNNLNTNLATGAILDLVEVSKHNTNVDCWIIVNSKVYNISNYASSHPGGARNILDYCGKEATQAFDTKGGKGDPHSTSANNMLAKDYVGDLNKKISQTSSENINSNTTVVNNNISTNLKTPVASTTSILNIAEISKHNTDANCWIIVNNKVYNISGYALAHPGGTRNITNNCGKEATSAFDTKGGNGSSHSSYADSLLAQYFLGNFNQSIDQKTIQQNTKSNPVPVNRNVEYDD